VGHARLISAPSTDGWGRIPIRGEGGRVRNRRILSVPAPSGEGGLTLMSEVKGRGSDLAFRLTAGRFLVMVIGCTGSEMER